MSTSEPPTSAERAICPFLRARSLAVLGRGLSRCAPSVVPSQVFHLPHADVQGAERGADGGGHLRGDPAGDERHRGADEQQRHRHLRGEADGEHVQLRHDARDDAEGDVGDQQRDQHRRRDLQGRGEHVGEDLLSAPNQRGELRGGGQWDELEGARETAQHPCFAADDEEDGHADKRVDAREDRRCRRG